MATWADVDRIAGALPSAVRAAASGTSWRVNGRTFAWERPLGTGDRRALGDATPDGDVLGVRVADAGVKAALLDDPDPGVFTIPHFDGFDAVLVALDDVAPDVLEELVVEAWRCRAGVRALAAYDVPREDG